MPPLSSVLFGAERQDAPGTGEIGGGQLRLLSSMATMRGQKSWGSHRRSKKRKNLKEANGNTIWGDWSFISRNAAKKGNKRRPKSTAKKNKRIHKRQEADEKQIWEEKRSCYHISRSTAKK
jgi:hypothetical protein